MRRVLMVHGPDTRSRVKGLSEAIRDHPLVVETEVDIRPGTLKASEWERMIKSVDAAMILCGRKSPESWGAESLLMLNTQHRDRALTLVLVAMPGAPEPLDVPGQLDRLHTLDFRHGYDDRNIEQLARALQGVRPPTGQVDGLEGRLGAGRAEWQKLIERLLAVYDEFLAERLPKPPLLVPWSPSEGLEANPTEPGPKGFLRCFEARGDRAVLLGKVGTGKSTFLRQLAAAATERAIADPARPIPVVIDLSRRWRRERASGGFVGTLRRWHWRWKYRKGSHPFGNWIVDHVNAFCEMGETTIRWERSRSLFLLFDGFDQIRRSDRPRVLRQLLNYFQTRGKISWVLASRPRIFEEACEALGASTDGLPKPIVLKAPETHDVDAWIRAAERSRDLRPALQALREDPEVEPLTQSPFWLHQMIRLPSLGELVPDGSNQRVADADTFRRRLLNGRVTPEALRKTANRGHRRTITENASQRDFEHLRWLARQLDRGCFETFRLEDIQPSWLESPSERWSYAVWSRALVALGVVLAAAPFLDPSALAVFGVVGGVTTAGLAGLSLEMAHFRRGSRGRRLDSKLTNFLAFLATAMVLGIVFSGVFAKTEWLEPDQFAAQTAVALAVCFALLTRHPVANEIRPQSLAWRSSRLALVNLALAAVGALVATWLVADPKWIVLSLLFFAGAGVVVVATAVQEVPVDEEGARPDRALVETRSAMVRAFAWTAGMLLLAHGGWWAMECFVDRGLEDEQRCLLPALADMGWAPAVALLVTLFQGGAATLGWWTLRATLISGGRMPDRWVDFLDRMGNAGLVERWGRGFTIHSILRRHLANQDTPMSATDPKGFHDDDL